MYCKQNYKHCRESPLISNINNLAKTQTIELLCLISEKYKKLDDHEFTITIPSEYCSEAIVKFLKEKNINNFKKDD